MSESTTLLDGRQPSRPLPAPHVPLVRLDGVDYPLAVAGRNDPRLLRALADAYPAATVVEFALDSLLELAPAYANRIADGLVEVFGNWDRPEDLRELFQSLLGMAPGVDMLRCLVWRHAVEGAAVGQVMRFGDVNACARAIAARARELGIEGCQAHRVRDRITAGARGKICPLPHEAFAAGTPPTGQTAQYHDPLSYLVGEYRGVLWHDGEGTGYIDVGHRSIRIGSGEWSAWLRGVWFEGHSSAIKDEAFAACTKTVGALASNGPCHPVRTRVARHGGKVYVDLANEASEVVEIGPDGWRVTTDPPVKFVRGPHAGPLPRPEPGGSVGDLRPFVNLSDVHYTCYVAALLDALKGRGEYMVAMITGEQGTAKTTIARAAVRLIDPRRATGPHDLSDVPGPPGSEGDLATIASNLHLVAFDNVGRITDDMSDAYCRVATGGGLSKRRLYTDGDVASLRYCAPLWLNAIPDVVRRGDLADRAVFLRATPLGRRRSSAELWAAFEAARPRILGALYDAVAAGLAAEAAGGPPDDTPLPRMAATGTWVWGCLPALGLEYDEWYGAVTGGQAAAEMAALEETPLGQAVLDWWAGADQATIYRDTPTRWRATLAMRCPVDTQQYLPSAQKIGGALRALAPALRRAGVDVMVADGDYKQRLGGAVSRVITIRAVTAPGSAASTDGRGAAPGAGT